jgi:hypothetical protein
MNYRPNLSGVPHSGYAQEQPLVPFQPDFGFPVSTHPQSYPYHTSSALSATQHHQDIPSTAADFYLLQQQGANLHTVQQEDDVKQNGPSFICTKLSIGNWVSLVILADC